MKTFVYKFILIVILVSLFLPASQAMGADVKSAKAPHSLPQIDYVAGGNEPALENIPPMLTSSQEQRLENASLRFVTGSEDQSLQLARDLKFVKNDGHPSNMCGPLAVAILKQAGLIDSSVSLHDFWLLNPRTAQDLLEATFPPEHFFHHRFFTPINQFDFNNFPLRAGDFIYLYAGRGGSFEHVLTVSRVDAFGRAFSVTNIRADDGGYLVQEVMLYDPTHPGTGIFYDWTDPRNVARGRTGLGGFELWRFAAPVQDKLPSDQAFGESLDSLLEAHGGKWNVVIKEVGGRVLYAHDPYARIPIASTIKVPMAMLFFQALKQKSVDMWSFRNYLQQNGTDGRTYNQLLYAMLVNSEEPAAASILNEIKSSRIDVSALLSDWGAPHTNIITRNSSAMDVVSLFEDLYTANSVLPEERQYILNLMRVFTPNDNTRLGVIRSLQPGSAEFYNKRGSIVKEYLLISDTALIGVPTPDGYKVYTIAAFGFGGGAHPATDRDLQAAIEELARAFWNYATAQGTLPQQ